MLDSYPDVLTVPQVGDILGMGRNALYKAIRAGEIPSFKAGPKLIRVSKERLKEYINDNHIHPGRA
jgi:excisionase family DNA binding protein